MDVQLNDGLADAAQLRAAMAQADIVPLLLVLAHLSGDAAMLDEAAPYIHGAWNFMHTVPTALQAKVRDRLAEVLRDTAIRLLPIGPDDVREMLASLRGQATTAGVVAFLQAARAVHAPGPSPSPQAPT